MWFETFKWLAAAVSIVGVELNIRHRRECFYVWVVTNAAWCIVDGWHGIYSQAVLHAVYFALAVRGILLWKKPRTSDDDRRNL